ncbi:hybrid sensor histidine kinase/response regulator [Alteromonas flava]|uniref:hybrid sensor histidine kinase/response regulator n=1 Tax=Alteromonas flava TaxID=2048003 RepID=UPI000C28D27C|nr:hybrid sensor histidine kinase/response regulator [Alteromonas flava]
MFVLGTSQLAHAQIAMQILDKDDSVRLSDNFLVLREGSNELQIGEVMDSRQLFSWTSKENPNYGFSDNGLWLMATFTHFTDNLNWAIDVDFSQLEKVDFYLVANNEIIARSQQGKLRAEQAYRIPILRAEIPSSTPIQLYLRIQSSSSSLIAPVTIRSEAQHVKSMLIDSLLWGMFYGGLIILAIYNLVLFFNVKEQSLLAYVGYISTVLLWQFVWGGHIHLLESDVLYPWLIEHTHLIFIIIGLSSGIFTFTFLDTAKTAPKAHIIVMLMLYLQAILGVASLLNFIPPIWLNGTIYAVGVLAICSYIAAGFESYSNQFQPARYFIFAWGMLAVGAVVGILSLIGFLPSNRFTAYCFQVGVFLEACIFSLALMEKSRTQLESEVEQATTDLRNNMELIEEQNARLDIARKDAIKASNVKSQFLANMSHEIRTPLNAILGFSRELLHAALPPDKQEQVKIINGAADGLLTIVNDILDFSKIEAGKLQLNNQPFAPNQLLEDMVSLMAKSAHQKQLEFIFELGQLPDKLIGDVYRIKQILNNLLGNAIKFTASGSITFSAQGRHLPHGLYELQLVVADTGIGISRQDRKKLFNAFSQVDDALNRNFQGTGLGLVISQELVRLMRGQLTLQSTPGQGSTFCVKLQMNQLSNRYYLSPSEEWRGKHVVIYDPLPTTRHASAKLLKLLGANVTSIESLAFLSEYDGQEHNVDFLFACLPQYKLEHRNDVLSHLLHFNAGKRILMYSGPDPFNHYPSLSQHFNTQLRMPLTPNKIDSLLQTQQSTDNSPDNARLNQLPKATVLAVDDMEMNLRLIETWLRDSPVLLTLTQSGAEAVQACQKQAFDIILMDVQMPNMDGLQATQLIRQSENNAGTPIIAVTAHAFKEEQERLMASGMDDYLPKPVELSQLIDVINRWCVNHDVKPEKQPSIDWALALKRANGNENTAVELLDAFISQLPSCIEQIENAWHSAQYEVLLQQIHRIHGASCYTGVSHFQALCDELESALKRHQLDILANLIPNLITESESVIKEGLECLDKRRY